MIKFCSLYSGSSGNCIYLGTEKTHVLVDAGVSGVRIANVLREIEVAPENICAILVTHEHSDHIKGAGIFSRKYNVPIYAKAKTWQAMRRELGKLSESNIRIIDDNAFSLGDFTVRSYSIPHDAADPVAYTFMASDKKISVATDIGCVTEEIYKNVIGSDIALIESNHDMTMLQNGKYPYHLKQRILSNHGHLSNDNAAVLATHLARKGTKHIYLGHLSHENNAPEIAFEATKSALVKCGFVVDKDVHVCVASREHFSEVTQL